MQLEASHETITVISHPHSVYSIYIFTFFNTLALDQYSVSTYPISGIGISIGERKYAIGTSLVLSRCIFTSDRARLAVCPGYSLYAKLS